jgi:hypothetical protein
MYETNPIQTQDIDKQKARQAAINNAFSKAGRVVTEQIPILGQLNSVKTALGQNTKFSFSGIQSIKWQMARDITEQYGLQSFTILPWYTKAVTITVTGKVYLGAFATDITASNGLINTSLQSLGVMEYIRSEMRALDSMLNNQGVTARSNAAMPSSLSIGVDGEPGSLTVLGFIKSFDVSENVDSPFLQQYTLTYLGVDAEWYAASRATNKFLLDSAKSSSQQTALTSPGTPMRMPASAPVTAANVGNIPGYNA